jgi:BirA family transcriptional regulator, biotin operon repressor / biotin---[acetyl-CoA-carboxylase] ligase
LIEYLAETGSTNADIAARVRGGEFVPEGHWLVADRQVAGRGRGGRAWFDGYGNFMGSTLVRPGHGDPPPGTLALVAGLALQLVVAALLPQERSPVLKWPNDLMLGTAKLAGILLEWESDAVILGVGVNLAAAPEIAGRETIAVSAFGPPPDRNHFASELARAFELELERWRSFGLEPIVNRWLRVGHALGTPLAVGEPGEEPLSGTFAGLAADGALQLRLADGTTRTIHAGEVRFARP